MAMDGCVSREEVLRLVWGLEALHLPLSAPRQSM
jgi:hypothetical protein